MLPLRQILHCSRTIKLSQFSKSLTAVYPHCGSSFVKSDSVIPVHVNRVYLERQSNDILSSNSFHTMNHHLQSNSSQSQGEKDKIALISSQMNMRLLNENSFLSWCRNAYLSSVVGIAMMEEATSTLAHTAGFGAFFVGGLNVFWGTSCHVISLVRLRHASGMSGLILTLNILGSMGHCLLWLFILVCYIGFLDDPNHQHRKNGIGKGGNQEDTDSNRFGK